MSKRKESWEEFVEAALFDPEDPGCDDPRAINRPTFLCTDIDWPCDLPDIEWRLPWHWCEWCGYNDEPVAWFNGNLICEPCYRGHNGGGDGDDLPLPLAA